MGRPSDARERLLESAIELVWKKTYGSVSVDAICELADVRKGSFYHFFQSKAELAAAAIQNHWDWFKPELDAIFSPTVDPLDRLRNYFDKIYNLQSARKREKGCVCGCPYFDLGAEAAFQEPELLERVKVILGKYFRYFESAVRDAHSLGHIQVDDPAATARFLFNFLEGSMTIARIHNDPELLKDLTPGAMQILGVVEGKRS